MKWTTYKHYVDLETGEQKLDEPKNITIIRQKKHYTHGFKKNGIPDYSRRIVTITIEYRKNKYKQPTLI